MLKYFPINQNFPEFQCLKKPDFTLELVRSVSIIYVHLEATLSVKGLKCA